MSLRLLEDDMRRKAEAAGTMMQLCEPMHESGAYSVADVKLSNWFLVIVRYVESTSSRTFMDRAIDRWRMEMDQSCIDEATRREIVAKCDDDKQAQLLVDTWSACWMAHGKPMKQDDVGVLDAESKLLLESLRFATQLMGRQLVEECIGAWLGGLEDA